MRQALRGPFNHWSLGAPIGEVVAGANWALRAWAGYFRFQNSPAVMRELRRYSEDRFRRWLWCKHGCTHGLWEGYPSERLFTPYGLYAPPITAAWKARR